MKASFEIEWPDDCGEGWMNVDNLMLCLNAYCKGVDLSATSLEGEVAELRAEQGDVCRLRADSARLDKLERILLAGHEVHGAHFETS